MHDVYPREFLTSEEFDSIFSQLLNNTEPLFKTLAERNEVNIYEVLISLVVFESHSDFDEKILTVFKAFDVDGGGTLDKKETSKFLKCSVNGLCKVVGMK